MLLRDSQEEVRVIFAALRNASSDGVDPLVAQLSEVAMLLNQLKEADRHDRAGVLLDKERTVG